MAAKRKSRRGKAQFTQAWARLEKASKDLQLSIKQLRKTYGATLHTTFIGRYPESKKREPKK